ncbi:unnamed protein product [Ambrosiozyma monospora]|uniref:Unnamed protein product n=1 Tax=Ambrosiozyma monospora TaxID=43982 RepID=A0A9W6YRI9_AMBMO|nr:unnamed protein product [Ambrosiozyma monospora]
MESQNNPQQEGPLQLLAMQQIYPHHQDHKQQSSHQQQQNYQFHPNQQQQNYSNLPSSFSPDNTTITSITSPTPTQSPTPRAQKSIPRLKPSLLLTPNSIAESPTTTANTTTTTSAAQTTISGSGSNSLGGGFQQPLISEPLRRSDGIAFTLQCPMCNVNYNNVDKFLSHLTQVEQLPLFDTPEEEMLIKENIDTLALEFGVLLPLSMQDQECQVLLNWMVSKGVDPQRQLGDKSWGSQQYPVYCNITTDDDDMDNDEGTDNNNQQVFSNNHTTDERTGTPSEMAHAQSRYPAGNDSTSSFNFGSTNPTNVTSNNTDDKYKHLRSKFKGKDSSELGNLLDEVVDMIPRDQTYDYSGGGGGGGSFTLGGNDINALFQSLNSGMSNNSDFMQGQFPIMQQLEPQQQFGAIGSSSSDSINNGAAPVSQFQVQHQMQQLQASFPGYQQQHQQQGQHQQQQDFTNGYY